METEVIVAVIALVGTLGGSFGGILVSNKLTNYRIEQLEKRVNEHNHLKDRMTAVEDSAKSAHKRIDELREAVIK